MFLLASVSRYAICFGRQSLQVHTRYYSIQLIVVILADRLAVINNADRCMAVPDAIPGGPPEPAVPVAAHHRVDGVRRCQRRDHLLPHHGVAAALGVPAVISQRKLGDGDL